MATLMRPYSLHRSGNDVHLELVGHFTAESAEDATEQFRTMIGTDVIRFIVDLGKMTGYDKAARVRWTEVLRPLKEQIDIIYFIGEAPPLIRMAASAVALAVGIRMRFVKKLAEVPASE